MLALCVFLGAVFYHVTVVNLTVLVMGGIRISTVYGIYENCLKPNEPIPVHVYGRYYQHNIKQKSCFRVE